MMMRYHLAFVLLAWCWVVVEMAAPIPCTGGNPLPKLDGPGGVLEIDSKIPSCGYEFVDNTNLFILKTDNLNLRANDSLQIFPDGIIPQPATFNPPFDAGYLISGLPQPKLVFNSNQTAPNEKTSMLVEYLLNVTSITINGDINKQFKITPVNLTKFDLVFTKTIPDWIHVEINGARIKDTALSHILVSDPSKTVTLEFIGNQTVEVKTSVVLKNCSGFFETKDEDNKFYIIGPLDGQSGYRCVNLYKATLAGQAHFEADFKDFLDMADFDDELMLDDGVASNRVDVVKSSASDFAKQVLSFTGNELAVIYISPRKVKPMGIQFKLSVQAKAYGGIVTQPGQLSFPAKGGQVRYLLVPESQQYVAIEFSDPTIQDVNITVSSGNKIIASLSGNTRLPPIIASNEPNVKIALDITAKSFDKLAKSVTFKSLKSSCHKITSTNSGGLSVDGGQGTCYWVLASKDFVGLTFDYNALQPNGCLTIQTLTQDKPIYTKCNLTQTAVLPTFILKQAYVKVDLPENNTHLDASLSASSIVAVNNLNSKAYQEVLSQGYPASYAWSTLSQSYFMKGAGKDYVLSFVDIDVRTSEKLLVNGSAVERANRTVIDDMAFSKVTALNITIARSMATTDFGLRRGFKITAKRYDLVQTVDLSKKNFTIPKNLTSLFVKISSLGKRVNFNATSLNQTFELSVYDGRSMQGRTIKIEESKAQMFNASSTSDTLLLSFNVSKQNTTLPGLTINYGTIDCGKTDHKCDQSTRCVPVDKLCKGVSYCDDGSDLKLACSSGPAPPPQVIETGVSSMTVFILCVLMLTLGVVSAMYGPDLYKTLENRFRSGRYTTFTSVD